MSPAAPVALNKHPRHKAKASISVQSHRAVLYSVTLTQQRRGANTSRIHSTPNCAVRSTGLNAAPSLVRLWSTPSSLPLLCNWEATETTDLHKARSDSSIGHSALYHIPSVSTVEPYKWNKNPPRSSDMSRFHNESLGSFGSCLLIWPIWGAIRCWPRAPARSLFRLCDPLSPGLERASLPILDNSESPLIGLQRKRITWTHNDVTAPGPSPPLFLPH